MESSNSIIKVAAFVVTVIGLVSTLSWRQSESVDRINQRIEKVEQRADAEIKDLEVQLNADRLRAAENYVSYEHLEKYVRIPMKEGFEKLERLIIRAASKQ